MKNFYERYVQHGGKVQRPLHFCRGSITCCKGLEKSRPIVIMLCAEKDRVEVELALEDMGKPIGVADYQLIVPK